jgi:hypothetical protein
VTAALVPALTAAFPPWHVFTSDTGRYWAARAGSDYGGSGETVEADTGKDMAELLAARSAS